MDTARGTDTVDNDALLVEMTRSVRTGPTVIVFCRLETRSWFGARFSPITSSIIIFSDKDMDDIMDIVSDDVMVSVRDTPLPLDTASVVVIVSVKDFVGVLDVVSDDVIESDKNTTLELLC